jgi:beta-glucanase (GH16 family)
VGWSGVTFFAPSGSAIINANYMTISANVWASASGQVIRLKVENHTDINLAVETDATTSASGWQRLTWNFSSPASGTPSYNSSTIYDKLSIFPEFGSTNAGHVFWIDDVAILGATVPAIGAPAPGPSPTPSASTGAGVKTLLWSQEFAGSANAVPDSTTWVADLGDGSTFGNPGWGNGEQQYYVNNAAKLDGQGNLAITATKNSGGISCYQGTCYWTSSKLTTKQKVGFQYGYIETRIKTPSGAGMWPALWLLGANINENGGNVYWPYCGEIDLMEAKGAAPYTVWGTPHSPNNHSGGTANSSTSLDSTFHTYAINWAPNRIQWLLDGQVYFEWTSTSSGASPYPFNAEFYLIMNLAVGGSFGGPVDSSLTSGTMLVDYVRFYSVDGVGQLIRH